MNSAAAKPDELTLFESRKFRVIRKSVTTTNGEPRETHLIRHPGAVVILPLLPDDDIVMIRNFRQTLDRELWELPAGTLDQPGEPPDHAAVRELEEEAGYRAGGLQLLCEMHPSPGVMDERIIAYVATDLTKTVQRLEATEQIKVEIVSAEKAMRMATDGTVTDAKTLVTLFRWNHERRND
jgi:ADP-ribose diphosphatase